MNIPGVKILGDPHLGRRFRTGVPLHRLGDREAMQWRDFEASLLEGDEPLHVCMGDVFDKATVPNAVVLKTAFAYRAAADRAPWRTFVIIMGNHDGSRSVEAYSSFDVLVELLAECRNVLVVRDEAEVLWRDDRCFAFVPWHPFKTAAEMVEPLLGNGNQFDAVFGHWDVDAFGDDTNLVPTRLLRRLTNHVVTGHVHLPSEFKRDEILVTVTGSMQPYSHAEDPDGRLYRTVTLEEIPEDPRNLNLRVVLRDGETLPDDLDCLSLTALRRQVDDGEEIRVDTTEFAQLEMRGLLRKRLSEAGVAGALTDEVLQLFEETDR